MNSAEKTFVKMPIISASTGCILGYEVLLKSFAGMSLQVFNQNPALFCQMSCQILKSIFALDQAKKIRLEPQLLFLNLSPAQFLSASTLEFLYYISESGQNLTGYVIELTEQDLHFELSRLKERILLFRQLGCQFAIDDFGAQQSNFKRIFELETEYIKVDRNLVAHYGKNVKGADVLAPLVEFCHKMNKKVVIEGIENPIQQQQAKDSGADFIQGFIYGLPQVIK